MRVFYLTVLTFCLSCPFAQSSVEDEFVDPLDMLNYDRSTKSMKRPLKSNTVIIESAQNDRCTVFLSRFVNILLKKTGISVSIYLLSYVYENLNYESNDNSRKVLKSYASVALSVEDLQLLENMAMNKVIDYIEIDRILNGMFTPVTKSPEFQDSNSFLDTYHIKEVLFWISVGSVTIILLYVIFKNIGHVFSVTFVIFVVFALAFASTWYTMYTKAEINRSVHLEHMPAHCFSKSGGWLSFSWLRTNNLDECRKYREAINLNPKYSIALTEVLAEMFSRILMKPVESLGESIYVFNKSALKDFPMWAQLIMVPIIIIIIIKTMLLSCALLVGRNLNMKSIFGYGGTSIGAAPTNYEKFASNERTSSGAHPFTPIRCADTRMPETPKFNLNINLFHQNASYSERKSRRDTSISYDNDLKFNNVQENDLIKMLKNEEIDRVDSNNVDSRNAKRHRHRTLSI